MSAAAPPLPVPPAPQPAARRPRARTSLMAGGEPSVWATGGALATALAMIVGLLVLIVWQGGSTFWPRPLVEVRTTEGRTYLGQWTREEETPAGAEGQAPGRRRLLRTVNSDVSRTAYLWLTDAEIAEETQPEWAVLAERRSGGIGFGYPEAFLVVRDVTEKDPSRGEVLATGPDATWAKFQEAHSRDSTGQPERYFVRMKTFPDGKPRDYYLPVADVVRAFPANRLGGTEKLGVYASRWGEFLFDAPRLANTEGGVLPALWGTVAMTLTLSVLVVPFGVLAALYLREYAKAGPVVSAVRVAINNLAGVPSIVYGAFGLGFFCYFLGGGIDQLFFADKLRESNEPTFGTGGLLWASLTLALLTLPVVIVATEEALAAVPSSMREGSYACGASKWQTIYRIVLPRALPGIMTGMILAMARGAGEVAPLMMVGAVNKAPHLPVDGEFPFVHLERSFMHLGLHIYDVGFQSPDSEAARPMVFTTTLLLIVIVALLNVLAVWLRSRLRRRFLVSHF